MIMTANTRPIKTTSAFSVRWLFLFLSVTLFLYESKDMCIL